jgi:hypothetical protein
MPLRRAIGVVPSLLKMSDGRSRQPALICASANVMFPRYASPVRVWHFQKLLPLFLQLQKVCHCVHMQVGHIASL